METKELLKMLSDPVSVAGNEKEVSEVIVKILEEYCEDIEVDNMGNITAQYKNGNKNGPCMMLEAHMDEIGLMVSGFSEEGSLLFVPVGGFDGKILPGSEVTVHTEKGDLYGIIGAKPPHLITDRSKAVKMEDMSVDIGFSRKEAMEKVKIGDIITFNAYFSPLSDFVAGRCFDDRAGVCAIIKALEYLEKFKLSCSVKVGITTQEELGLRGARVLARSVQPDCAICVDAGFGTSANSSEGFPLDSGVIVSVGPNLHPKLTELILQCAKDEKIAVTVDVENGNTGTNAWEIQVSGKGIPTALLSFPLRYMHSTYEVVSVNDIENMAKLLCHSAVSYKGGEQLCY